MKLRILLLVSCAAGCSLTGGVLTTKSAPPELRYFSPEPPQPASTETATQGAPGVRVGRIRASSNLRSHVMYRASPYELGEYEDFRWTDEPEAYLRRALVRALSNERGAASSKTGAEPTLDVELLAFEEVRRPDGRAGAVEMTYTLSRDGGIITTGHTRVERPAASMKIEAVIAAISAALDAAAEEVAHKAFAALEPPKR
jgi:cholesterol transport system auxiliary component